MDLLQIDDLSVSKMERISETLLSQGADLGLAVLKALIIFIIGQFIIRLIKKFIKKSLEKREIAPAVKTFVSSLVNILLTILLIVAVISALGVETTSFAALIAAAGVAIGMALSGNLSNFAGGLIILLFKPFRIGDYIATATVGGTVTEIQIFHTILTTPDNVKVHIPNGILSSGYINNYNVDKRQIEWIFRISYGENFDKVKQVILDVLSKDSRIFADPAPFVELHQLDASSVNVVVRVWTKGSDYWRVYFHINQSIYATFNQADINFPLPQLTVHQTKD